MLNLYAELFLLVVVVVPSGQRLDEDAEWMSRDSNKNQRIGAMDRMGEDEEEESSHAYSEYVIVIKW